jgi:hypothetical protein
MGLRLAWACTSVAVVTGSLAIVAACGSRTGLDLPLRSVDDRDAQVGDDGATGFDGFPGFDSFPGFDAGPDAPGPQPLQCADAGTDYIYVIDETNNLYSFYPAANGGLGEFNLVGTIDCPAPVGAEPFSMAVDHKGVAYVVFSNQVGLGLDGGEVYGAGDGNLYRVSTRNAACEATPFIPHQKGFPRFGMGFVASTDDAGNGIETLYVASDTPAGTPSELGIIDLTTFVVHEVSTFGAAGGGVPVFMAELTSTADGRLFGFFAPDNSSEPSYIIQIDPRTAAVKSTVELPGVEEGSGWAFGFWGGNFYTFTAPDGTSVVTRYNPSDGSVVQLQPAPGGALIVGAGVSTCAPQE